jgi:predicted nucleic acid-binding Zn ribbon protein
MLEPMPKPAATPKTCPICGKPIPPRTGLGPPRVYCSDSCRAKANARNKSFAEREAGGNPLRLFSLTTEVEEQINVLTVHLGLTRSEVVRRAVVELFEREFEKKKGW